MPLIDMPLDRSCAYQGRNPRPADFDAFWDGGARETARPDPRAGAEPARLERAATPNASTCGSRGSAGAGPRRSTSRPAAGGETHPAVLMFHGYTGSSGEWLDKLGYVAQGFCVAAMDCRGQGGHSEDTGGVAATPTSGHIIRGLDDAAPRSCCSARSFWTRRSSRAS